MNKCEICGQMFSDSDTYSYRGAYACEEHFDLLIAKRDGQRRQIIAEEAQKTEPMKGFDLGDNPIGRENRRIFASKIEVASKESARLKAYERPEES